MYNATWKAWDGHIESKECKDTSELDSFIELWTGHTGHINYDAQICCALDGCGIVTWEVVPLSYDCLACGEMVVTDDEDRHVVGLCDCCLDGDYSSPYDPPSQSDYDYTCTCEDAPCCGCNSEIGQISILYAVIVTILAVILHSVYNALLVPMLAVLGSI
jgi:hypothetical protein